MGIRLKREGIFLPPDATLYPPQVSITYESAFGIDWLAVQDITFDEDAAAPDTDLSGYTLIDHES